MAKKNIELLKKLRTRFLRMRHPEHFDMEIVAAKGECGTVMCIAGHTLHLAGYKMRIKTGECFCGKRHIDFISPSGRRVAEEDGMDEARKRLGLSPEVARNLFTDMSLKTPKQAAERIAQLIQETSA